MSNSFVDQFPMFVLMKLKDKFDMNCQDGVGGMLLVDFKKFYQQLQFD